MNEQQGKSMNESMQSESINELAEALAKAQNLIEGASKDASNPFYKSKYADLHTVIACAKEPLASNGLSVVQPIQMISDKLCLVTILMHKSGQWIKSVMPLLLDAKETSQSMGSKITYFRRYSYSSLIGISQYDDDGEASMDRKDTKPRGEEKKSPETIEVGPKVYKMDDLVNKILNDKKVIPDQVKLTKYIQEKADVHNRTPAQIITSAMRSEEQFEGFYLAYTNSLCEHKALPS